MSDRVTGDAVPRSKRIGLAVCGGIAAYKSAELASLLVKNGFTVYPIMTRAATEFLQPLTLEALTGNRVLITGADSREPGGLDHISLLRDLDLLVIAPLTANTCAKLAHGIADQFLGSAYLAYRGLTLACPAMNTAMLEHPATQRNLKVLRDDGVLMCMGQPGVLACGDVGLGRVAEPTVIFDVISHLTGSKIPYFVGKKVLVNAGPTCEDLDPVRFITNRSSGKMGFALARALRNAGAEVTLIHGPVHLPEPENMNCVKVRSASEMADACLSVFSEMEITILTAAVADFSATVAPKKLKKSEFDGRIELHRTTDILKTMGQMKTENQILVGFAAETHDEAFFAKKKLQEKNVDLIFSNTVGGASFGFGSDENKASAWLKSEDAEVPLGPDTKKHLAIKMIELIAEKFQK